MISANIDASTVSMTAASVMAMHGRLTGEDSTQAREPRSMGRTTMRLTVIMISSSGTQVNRKP